MDHFLPFSVWREADTGGCDFFVGVSGETPTCPSCCSAAPFRLYAFTATSVGSVTASPAYGTLNVFGKSYCPS